MRREQVTENQHKMLVKIGNLIASDQNIQFIWRSVRSCVRVAGGVDTCRSPANIWMCVCFVVVDVITGGLQAASHTVFSIHKQIAHRFRNIVYGLQA